MRRKYRRKYDWDILGKHCGLNIIGRLDWINGKPMVWVGMINLFLLIFSVFVKESFLDVPEVLELTSSLGWNIFNVIVQIAFWVLFVDGVIFRILWNFTRGKYFRPYLVRLIKFPQLNNKEDVKEDLAWAWFLHTHPQLDYELEELKNRCAKGIVNGRFEFDDLSYQQGFRALMKKHGVVKNERGKYFSWNDKKYKKMLEKM